MKGKVSMLKIRLYLDPSDGGRPKEIAHANIINTRIGDHENGDYYAHFYVDRQLVQSSHISGWPRLERGPWELLAASLAASNLILPNNGSGVTTAEAKDKQP